MPRARPRARPGLCPRSSSPRVRLAPARCRPQLQPERAERQARPAGTGSPGRAELIPRGCSAAGAVLPSGPAAVPLPSPARTLGTHVPRMEATRVAAPTTLAEASSPGPAPCAFPHCRPQLRWDRIGPASALGERPFSAGEAAEAGHDQALLGPVPSALGRPRRAAASRSCAGVREPGQSAAPVPAAGCQLRDAAPGLSQGGRAGVSGLLMVILFISLAASPELCLQRGLVVPAAPALCLDRGLL